MEIIKSRGGLYYAWLNGTRLTAGFGTAALAKSAGLRMLDHKS